MSGTNSGYTDAMNGFSSAPTRPVGLSSSIARAEAVVVERVAKIVHVAERARVDEQGRGGSHEMHVRQAERNAHDLGAARRVSDHRGRRAAEDCEQHDG